MLARFSALVPSLALAPVVAFAQDAATSALTPAAAEKFVRATQHRVANANPEARQTSMAAGPSSREYVASIDAAMTALLVE